MPIKTDVLNETISTFTCSNNNEGSHADRIKMHLLVIKFQQPSTRISETRKEAAEMLKNIPIDQTGFSDWQPGG